MPESARNKPESNLSADKVEGKLSYGWIVALASSSVMFAAGSIQSVFGVFVKPLINEFGWSRAAISGCVTARSILSGLIAPIAGNLSDRYGPRKLILAGVFLTGLSYLLSSRITSLWQLYFFLSLLTGIGLGGFFSPTVATVTRWFGGRAGLANGIVMSGFSLAQILLPPVATYFIIQYSWEMAFIILGMTAWGVGILSWSFIRNPPADAEDISKASETKTPATDYYTLSEALRTPALWFMFTIWMIAALCFHMMAIHIVAAAIDAGITPEAAAIILTLNGITMILGRLALGSLASKIGNKIVLALCLAIQAPALFSLAGASDLHVFYIIALVYGLAYGGIAPIMPTMVASLFGTKSVGSIFGILYLGFTTGVAIGPLLAGYIFDVTGSYYTAFSTAAVAMAIAFLLCLLLKPPQKKAIAI